MVLCHPDVERRGEPNVAAAPVRLLRNKSQDTQSVRAAVRGRAVSIGCHRNDATGFAAVGIQVFDFKAMSIKAAIIVMLRVSFVVCIVVWTSLERIL